MGTINTAPTERVRYTLSCRNFGSIETTEIEGWESDDKEIARNEEYHGIFPKFSNNLKFLGDAREWLLMAFEIYDINAEVRLVKDEMHPRTDLWEHSYDGYLDMSTKEDVERKLSVKFNSGGLEQILKARESDDFEIDRETTVDGKPMDPLRIDTVELDGRKIFLKTLYEVKPPENYVSLSIESNAGNTRNQTVSVPFKVVSKSHEEAQDSTQNATGSENEGSVAQMFFLQAENECDLKIKFALNFRVSYVDRRDIDWSEFRVRLGIYEGGTNALVGWHDLLSRDTNNIMGQTFSLNFDETVHLLVGQSISLDFLVKADFRVGNNAHVWINISDIVCLNSVEQDSFFEKSKAKFILMHEALDRQVEIMTNQKRKFYSRFFGRTELGYAVDGPGAHDGVTHGFWVRGFDKLPLPAEGPPKIENPFKPLTISFKDSISSLTATHNIGLGIERIGFSERVVVEDQKHFYDRNVTIRLPDQAKKVKRTVATKYYYSTIEIGYDKGGNYEEAMGLDEYNGKSTFTTIITRVKQSLILISKIRWDSYGKEFARRKQMFRFPTNDTSYDNDVMGLSLKKDTSGVFKERKWRDDLAQAPTGTYDPESATNLLFSPFNLVLKHGWKIAAGLTKFATDYLSYASSTANSKLSTKKSNGNEISENGRIVNSELQRPRYVPEYIEFEHTVTFDIMQMVEGTTLIRGERVYNVYGLVEFLNENSEIETGYLMNLKPNDGKWKLLKSNR